MTGYIDAAFGTYYALTSGISLRELKRKLKRDGLDLRMLSSVLNFLATALNKPEYFRAAKMMVGS